MEKAWIPMKDGVRLAATLYTPGSSKPGEKFPALLEYLPYRKDDGTAAGDYPKHSYFARRGYVSARVDIRGFGASEGTPPEREYSEQEQIDGEQIIAWLAHQTWSNGNVGMFGISWGGFTSLQMAMRHPPALKAILAVDATTELFHDDVHYVRRRMVPNNAGRPSDLFRSAALDLERIRCRRLRRGQPRCQYAERRAGNVVQSDLVAEFH
jgi:putative CocE/NonD family hydrolase